VKPSFPAIRNLQAAGTLALDDDSAVPRAQFDLANVSARAVNLFGNQSCALSASAFLASRDVSASVDANFCRSRIEVGLQHSAGQACPKFHVNVSASIDARAPI
jgi:hypothetical protein